MQYLDGKDRQHSSSDGVHQTHVIVDQGLSAASDIDVELLCLVVIVIMSGIVGDLMLNAWSWRAGVTATKWDTVDQVTAIHIALYVAAEIKDTTGYRYKAHALTRK